MTGPDAQRLRDAAAALPPGGIELAQLLACLPGQQLGWLLLLCALPSALPGLQLGWVGGPLLLFLAWASWCGRSSVELPPGIARRQVSFKVASQLLNAMAWTAQRLGQWCRPAWPRLAGVLTGRPAAALVATMALLILLPLPGSNFVPALAITALVGGLLWQDGRAVGLAYILAAAGLGIVVGMTWGMGMVIQKFL